MTLTPTYNGDLSRVQLALSGMPDGSVQVQRVANAAATEALWARGVVRGGLALPIVAGVGTLDDFYFFADVPNFYRTVPVDPPAGLLLPGADGDYASTPDDPTLDITGDLDVRADATRTSWRPASDEGILGKYESTGDQRQYRFELRASGVLRLRWSTNGTSLSTEDSTVSVPDVPGRLAMRAKLDVDNGGVYQVIFETAPTSAGPWTQLGDPKNGAVTTSIFGTGTAPLEVGAYDGGFATFQGNIHSAEVRAGIDGTVVADPDFAAQAGGAGSFDDAAGRTWTVNGAARVVGVETASITPSLDGQIWLKNVRHTALNRPVTVTDFTDPARAGRDTAAEIVGRSAPVAQTELRGSAGFTLELQTQTAQEAGALDIILAAGGVWFVHVPAGCPVPGGYVTIGDTEQVRRTRSARSPRRYTTLPCRVVAPPAPQVTGTLLVAETLFRLYGDATALHAAHATGRSLLATIADPSDLVVV